RALERRDDLRGLAHVLAVEADGPGHRGHARGGVVRHLPGVRIVAAAPEAGTVPGVAAVVDVDRRDAELVACGRLEVAHHVADAGVAGDVHALAVGEGQLRGQRAGQAEAERRHVAPAEVATRDLRLVHGARLVTRVPGVGGHEGVPR